MRLLIILLVLVLCEYGSADLKVNEQKLDLNDFHPLHGSHIRTTVLPPNKVKESSHPRIHADHLHLRIPSKYEEVELELEIYDTLFSETALVSYYNADGLISQGPPVLRTYRLAGSRAREGVMTLVDVEQNIWQGRFNHGNSTYKIRPSREVKPALARRGISETSSPMVMYKLEDEKYDEDVEMSCGLLIDDITQARMEKRALERRVQAGPPSNTPDCPSPPKRLLQSVAADHQYHDRFASATEAEIQDNWNILNGVYFNTVAVEVVLDEIIIQTAPTSDSWNPPNCLTISETLYEFSEWRQLRSPVAGLWHLMTDCYTSGTVGLAWVGQVCEVDSREQSPNEWVSGTGVSSYLSGDRGWRVIAHETGHNFGAPHTTDGIMIASNIADDWFAQASQEAMCGHIDDVLNERYNANCLLNALGSCGDNVVQSGEECDCGPSGCQCCSSNCTLLGRCDPSNPANACCNAQTCDFVPANANLQCAPESTCALPVNCNGASPRCPLPGPAETTGKNLENCTDNTGRDAQCYNGQCGGSCVGMPPLDGLWCNQVCEAVGAAYGDNVFWFPCDGTECWLSCRSENFCTQSPDACCDVDFQVDNAYAMPFGAACSQGICDGMGNCIADFFTNQSQPATPIPNVSSGNLPILTSTTCPSQTSADCSGNGNCIGSVCSCDLGFRGLSCNFGPVELDQDRTTESTGSLDPTINQAHFFRIDDLARNQNVTVTVESNGVLQVLLNWNSVPSRNSSTAFELPLVDTEGLLTYEGSNGYPASSGSSLFISIYPGTNNSAIKDYSMTHVTSRQPAFLVNIVEELAGSFVGSKAMWTVIGIVLALIVIGVVSVIVQIWLKHNSVQTV